MDNDFWLLKQGKDYRIHTERGESFTGRWNRSTQDFVVRPTKKKTMRICIEAVAKIELGFRDRFRSWFKPENSHLPDDLRAMLRRK